MIASGYEEEDGEKGNREKDEQPFHICLARDGNGLYSEARNSRYKPLDGIFPLTYKLNYALRAADKLGVWAPLVAAAREVYKMAIQNGLGEMDIAAISEAIRGRQP